MVVVNEASLPARFLRAVSDSMLVLIVRAKASAGFLWVSDAARKVFEQERTSVH